VVVQVQNSSPSGRRGRVRLTGRIRLVFRWRSIRQTGLLLIRRRLHFVVGHRLLLLLFYYPSPPPRERPLLGCGLCGDAGLTAAGE
jgi:hypothetical protein